MSDLLSIGRAGVLAYQGALTTIGENVTNADTTGYTKRTVVLKEQTALGGSPYTISRSSSAFGGVQASEVARVWNQYQAQNSWSANSDASGASSRLNLLQSVEGTLDDSDNGLGTRLSAIFTNATQLASTPGDTSLRQTMLASIGSATDAIQQTATSLATVADTAKTQANALVDQTNATLASLAKVNGALHTAAQGSASRAQLEDQRDSLIGTLSGNISVDVNLDADGAATVQLSDYAGPTLLTSTSALPAHLSLQVASTGQLALNLLSGTTTTPTSPTGGALAGIVDASATIAGRRQQLDTLASTLTTQLNTWQAQGLTPAGNAGQPLLTGTTATTIGLATSDPSAIAAASSSATNGNLLALPALRDANGVEAQWRGMVNNQALLVSTAQTESDAATTRQSAAATALDGTTGVTLDDEAAELLRFQQAYTASSKIISTARETLQNILDLF